MATTPVAVSGQVITLPRPMGAPSKYRPEYCDRIMDYFTELAADRTPERIVKSESSSEGGSSTAYHLAPRKIPTVVGFATSIGVTRETIHEWTRRYPDFADAFARAREIEEDVIGQEAARGLIPPNIAIMLGQSYTAKLRNRMEIADASDSIANGRVVELLRAMPAATRNTVIEALRAAEAKLAEVGQGAIDAGPAATEGA